MDNYKEKRQGGYTPRGGNRERSFNSDFNAEYRKKQRPRFTREQDGQRQYGRNDYRANNGEGNRRYSSYQRPQYNNGADGEPNYNRYDGQQGERQYGNIRQSGYRSEGRSVNNGNYSRAYSTQHRAGYGQRGNRSTSYDPNAK